MYFRDGVLIASECNIDFPEGLIICCQKTCVVKHKVRVCTCLAQLPCTMIVVEADLFETILIIPYIHVLRCNVLT